MQWKPTEEADLKGSDFPALTVERRLEILLPRLEAYEAALREIAAISEKHIAPAVLAKRIARKALGDV